eukprot:m.66457 g.66457  ORF g.66457 m.66457 type:complete len:375 (-) comp14055_c0_seq2:1924-3048(-)
MAYVPLSLPSTTRFSAAQDQAIREPHALCDQTLSERSLKSNDIDRAHLSANARTARKMVRPRSWSHVCMANSSSCHPLTPEFRHRDVLLFLALSRLFEPPLDLLFEGDFTAARTAASRSKRHVLVNIQDPQNFDSQRLNRDVWKNDLVKEVIRGQFIFWQQYQETPAAAQYASWYPINEVPHVAIIDGETGERILILPPKTTAELFLERACTLGEPASSSHQSLSTPTQSTPLTEDEQMRLALAASLEHTNDVITIDDDDDDDGPSTSQGSTMKTDLDTQQPSSLKLKPEPAKGAADSCTIRFIMPDNSRLQRNFYLDETLAHVTHYLRHQADIPSKTFRLMHGRPPSDLQAKDSGLTLGELDMRNEVVRVDHD